ncbi:hypothetical protein S40293_00402 [Stachybotrys chartarum IBT 40293]|nr:hypothetical protein S40293_00402 [Stachybotrys chartarum IBT 40293]
MAYPPPPGTSNLPAKPPAARAGFRPAFSASPQPPAPSSYPTPYSAAPASQYGASPSYVGAPATGANSTPAYSYPQQPPQQGYGQQSYGAPGQSYGAQSYGTQSYGLQSYGPQSTAPQSYAAPQIKNPFPIPGTGPTASEYDSNMTAQLAQWQSAYSAAPTTSTTRDGKPVATVADMPKPEVPAAHKPEKKKTVVREGGGKKWTDDTLLEWDDSHLRLFVGNLAGETTDDSLLKAFSRWKSVQKARVIRDKRTTKSKGFGFVSFSDADDFFQAAKEMNGKYIQSHPVIVKKATTEIKATTVKENKGNWKNNKNKNKNKGDKGEKGAGGYEPKLGPMPGQGVVKPGQKTKNGLRLLG